MKNYLTSLPNKLPWFNRLIAFFATRLVRFKRFFFKLNFSQRAYLIAAALWLLTIILTSEPEFLSYLALFFSVIGFGRETYLLFHKFWETKGGKIAIIVLYASMANVSLAFAALKINEITGIEPFPFVFTLGFSTLVIAPFWIGVSSLMILILTLIILNIWIIIRLLLKPFGVNINIHWEDKEYAGRTMLLRILLIPPMIAGMTVLIAPYVVDDPELSTLEINLSEQNDNVVNTRKVSDLSEEDIEYFNQFKQVNLSIKKLIADFIFTFEAYEKSICTKEENQRSVIIDENSVLLISEDPDSELGYKYTLKACDPAYE
ncbi:hypothetical protein [Glaciecola sp. 1036]|uniref:hypothetical protein n=1 Tax=Alteromonadaceae TaxID=72275 RepID=UPI003D00E17F